MFILLFFVSSFCVLYLSYKALPYLISMSKFEKLMTAFILIITTIILLNLPELISFVHDVK
jgi:phosphatidylglycerophosphate synthase